MTEQDLLAELRESFRRPPSWRCPECGDPVDAEGMTRGDCPGGSGEKCPECWACACDGSC